MKKTKLKQYFGEQNLKQNAVCRELHLHPNHFSRVINGHKGTSPQTIKLLRLYLQNLLDKKFEEHEKWGMELKEQQQLLNEALEEVCHNG